MRARRLAACAALLALGAILAAPPAEGDTDPARRHDKVVIAHRGASGLLPEHTLEAYVAAYFMGADYIEPDLVMTADGVLIALHDIHLERTTNVEEVYPDRARPDGRWYAADFTLAEVKRLSVHERTRADGTPVFRDPRRFRVDSKGYQIPTLQEVIETVQELNRLTGCDVGIYPETKDPAFHDAAGLRMEETLLKVLARHGYAGPDARVFIQSFDPANLKEMRFELGTDLPLIQLISGRAHHDRMVTPEGLDDIATYANGIGPNKRRIEDDAGRPVNGNELVTLARARGLLVHPWTFRADVLPGAHRTFEDELRAFFRTYDVDGVFTDQTAPAVRVARSEGNSPDRACLS